jgi:hypothetical protein
MMRQCFRVALVAALVSSAGYASAFSGVTPTLSGTTAKVVAGGITSSEMIASWGGGGGGVTASGPVNILGPAGKSVPGTLSVNIPRAAAFSIASRALATAIPAVGVGSIIWEVWKQTRMKPNGAGAVLHDPGLPLGPETQYCSSASGTQYCGTRESVAAQTAGRLNTTSSNGGQYTFTAGGCEPIPGRCAILQINNFNNGMVDVWGMISFTEETTQACPIVLIEGTLRRGSIGWDGRCESGSYSQPMSAQEAADMAFAATQSAQIDSAAMLREVLGFSDGPIPATTYDQALDDAPKTIQGPTTTTTAPDGTVTETATGWNFRKDPVVRNSGEWLETKTVTTKNSAGQTTGTTTTTQEPNGTQDPTDPCVSNPGRLGCANLGEVPPAEPLPREEFPSAAPSVPFTSAAGCPTLPAFTVYGQTFSINTAPLCDLMSTLRPLFLAIGAAAAAFIFMQGFRV